MKKNFHSLKCYVLIIAILLFAMNGISATIYSNVSGAWNSSSTWQGGVVPGAGDDVIIQDNDNVYLNADADCASFSMASGGSTTTFSLNGFTLNVSGAITINQSTSNNKEKILNIGDGTVICNTLTTINSSANSRICRVNIASGILTVSGNIVMGVTQVRNIITITGAGTINLGGSISGGDLIPGTLSTFNFNGISSQVIPNITGYTFCNITINNPAGVTIQSSITATYVTGNFTIESGLLTLTSSTITGNSLKTFLVKDNATLSLSGSAGLPGTYTISLEPQSRVIYQNTAAQSVAVVGSPGYGILELNGTSAKTAAGGLYIQSNLLINGTASFSAGSYTHSLSGNFINNSVFTASASTIVMSGTTTQQIAGTSASTFNNLTINNSAGVTIIRTPSVNGTLTLTSGIITTSANAIQLGNSASVSGGNHNSYVYGNLTKGIAASTTSKTFEVGDGNYYYPLTIAITGNTNSTGKITVTSVAGDHPQIGSSTIDNQNSVNSYWSISNSGVTGITSFSLTLGFESGGIDPSSNPQNYIGGFYNGSVWSYPVVGTKTATSTQLTGLTAFGDFQLGQLKPLMYRTVATGNWNAASTWETSRNGTSWSAATTFPNYRDGSIDIRSPHVITVTSAIGKDTVDQVTIQSGATVIVNVNPSGYWLLFNDGVGTDLQLNGTLEYQDDVFQLLTGATMAVGNGGTYRINFSYGGTYRSVIPTATWDPNSTIEIVACNQLAPSGGLGQSFGNFTWNYSGQTANINLGGALTTINGNFNIVSTGTAQLQLTATTALTLITGGNLNISGGILDFASGAAATKNFNLYGNYNQTGGTFTNSNSNVAVINFLGSGKTFSQTSGTLTSTYINWVTDAAASTQLLTDLPVASSRTFNVFGTLKCGANTNVTGSGSFILNPGATLMIASTGGIAASGSTGNVRTTGRTFSVDANYIYNGTSAQVTGTGLPAYVKNLTISNNAGVNLSGNVTVKNTLDLDQGVFTAGAFKLGFHTGDIPITRNTGKLSVNSSSSLQFGEAGFTGGAAFTFPAGLFSTSPVINNLTLNRTNAITLNEQALPATGVVFVNGTLNTNNNLTLLSTATQTALIDGSGTGTINGNVTIQRYLPSSYGYRYLSSPINGGKVGDFSSYIDLGAAFPNFYEYNENQTTSGWDTYTTSSSLLYPLTGYCGNFGTNSNPVTFSVTGVVNNGNYIRSLSNNNQTYTQGFNLAGNPYPSPINWDASSGWTKTNIDNAVYYFNPGSTDQYSGTYSSYVNGISSDGTAGPVIPAFQGFFVHVSNGTFPVTGTLASTNAVRVNTLNPVYHKNSEEIPFVRIKASYAEDENKSDFAVISADENATASFDSERDALKLFNTDVNFPNIFTLSGDQKLSINSIPFNAENIEIPIGISGKTGTVILDFDNQTASQNIYLHDKNLKTYIDILKNPRNFIFNEEGNINDRYSLVISQKVLENEDPADNFFVYSSKGSIFFFVKGDENPNTDITIFDLTGRIVWAEKMSGKDRTEIKPGFSNGIYIVRCTTPAGSETAKIFYQN